MAYKTIELGDVREGLIYFVYFSTNDGTKFVEIIGEGYDAVEKAALELESRDDPFNMVSLSALKCVGEVHGGERTYYGTERRRKKPKKSLLQVLREKVSPSG